MWESKKVLNKKPRYELTPEKWNGNKNPFHFLLLLVELWKYEYIHSIHTYEQNNIFPATDGTSEDESICTGL